jgi:hypothetical protein
MQQGQGIILRFTDSDKLELNLQMVNPKSFSRSRKRDGHRSGPPVRSWKSVFSVAILMLHLTWAHLVWDFHTMPN